MNPKDIHAQRINRLNQFFDDDIYNFELKPSESLVWVCLYRHTNWSTGIATLAISRIKQHCYLGDKTARRAIKVLCDKQLIKRITIGTGTRSSIYAILSQDCYLLPQTKAYLSKKRGYTFEPGDLSDSDE